MVSIVANNFDTAVTLIKAINGYIMKLAASSVKTTTTSAPWKGVYMQPLDLVRIN